MLRGAGAAGAAQPESSAAHRAFAPSETLASTMFAARNLTRLARPSALAVPHRPFHATAARLGLLKGMDPMLTADLLHVLRSAGHGDEITLVDCNFPAASTATKTVTGVPVVLAGCDLPTAVDAICSIMPLDFFVEPPHDLQSL